MIDFVKVVLNITFGINDLTVGQGLLVDKLPLTVKQQGFGALRALIDA